MWHRIRVVDNQSGKFGLLQEGNQSNLIKIYEYERQFLTLIYDQSAQSLHFLIFPLILLIHLILNSLCNRIIVGCITCNLIIQQKMSYNSFDYYRQLREYQLHVQRLANPQSNLPSRQPLSPSGPKFDRLKDMERQHKVEQIQRQNQIIMHKLVSINRRKPEISQSVGSLRLPAIHKQRQIPLYEQQNGKIAKKIIESKSSIDCRSQLAGYRSLQARKRNISKYLSQDGVIVNRKKYLAELMLLKKMRVSQVLSNSRQQ